MVWCGQQIQILNCLSMASELQPTTNIHKVAIYYNLCLAELLKCFLILINNSYYVLTITGTRIFSRGAQKSSEKTSSSF